MTSGFETPSTDFVNNKCWFIIETDQYPERRQKWVDEQVPKDGKLIDKKRIKDIDIQLWSKYESK